MHRDLAPVQIDLAAACTDSGNWAESVSTLLKNGAIVRCLGDMGTKMAPSLCWDFKLSNEGSFVEIGQEMTKLGWKVWKKSLQSLRAESIAVCMQRRSFRRRSLSWETSFDWSEMKVRALPAVSPHPAVWTWPGFQIKWTQPDFSWFFMRTIPAAENRGDGGTHNQVNHWFPAGVIWATSRYHGFTMAPPTEEIGRTEICQKCKKGHFETIRTNFAVLFDVPTGSLCKNI